MYLHEYYDTKGRRGSSLCSMICSNSSYTLLLLQQITKYKGFYSLYNTSKMQTSFLFIQKYIKKKNKEEIIFTSQFLQIIHFVGASFLQSFLVSPAVSVTTLNNSRGYWQRQVMKMKITTALQPMTVLCISQ